MLPIPQLFHWRITHLVEELTEENQFFYSNELQNIMMIYGEDAKIVVISALIDEIDFKNYRASDAIKISNLKEELLSALLKANASNTICRSIESGQRLAVLQNGGKLPDDYFECIIKTLNLPINQTVMLAFCVLKSQYVSIAQQGLRVIAACLPQLRDLSDIPDDTLQGLSLLCNSNRDLAHPSISGQFLDMLSSLGRRNPALGLGSLHSGSIDMEAVQAANTAATQRMSIASILNNFGCQCSQTAASFKAALDEIMAKVPLDEEQLGKIIALVIQPPAVDNMQIFNLLQANDGDDKVKAMSSWNLEVIAEVIAAESRSIDWNLVVRYLDQPHLKLRSEQDFHTLVKLIIRMSNKPMSAVGLMGLWDNKTAQLAIIILGAALPRNVMDFSSLCSADNKLEGDVVPFPPNFSWVSVHVYKTLMELASRGLVREVQDALVNAAGMYPEYVTIGLAQVQDPSTSVRADILRRTLPLFTALPGSRSTSIAVMKKLLDVNQDLMVILCRISLKRCTTMQHILEVDARLKSIGVIGRRVEEEGVLDELIGYWCVLADRGEVNLEERLTQQLAKNPQHARFLIAFAKMNAETLRSRSADGSLLSYESCAMILRVAQQHPSVVPIEEIRALAAYLNQHMHSQQAQHQQAQAQAQAQQHQQLLQAQQHQQLQHVQSFSQPTSADGVAQAEGGGRIHGGSESLEVEEEANSYFQKIYTSDITIPDVIQLLKKFKASSDNRETEIFRCMIHNLFDEYRFFHKYPDKELQVTGRLFGSLIQHQLVSSITLGIALRYVLEALRKDPEQVGSNEKMFRFGKIALDQFRSRLGEWPQYCSHLIQIPHLAVHCLDIFNEAQRAIITPLSGAPPISGPGLVRIPSTPSPSIEAALQSRQVDALSMRMQAATINNRVPDRIPMQDQTVSTPIPEPIDSGMIITPELPSEIDRMAIVNVEVVNLTMPPENIRDQIHFIVNNIAKVNADEKSIELKNILISDYFNWFANYLVVKRISTQPNLHPLYMIVLDMIESNPLVKTVMLSVYHNVTKLLQSPKITTSSSERSLLRNLGSWLGQLTLARNKPLLHRCINLKELILWGYETGRLIAVCSFVAKIVEGARESKVFRPPNPWLMALLGVMRELYELEDLKINIKFEVQVLCKNINIKIEDIPRGTVLLTRRAPVKNQYNQDFTFKGQMVTPVSPSLAGQARAEDASSSTQASSVPVAVPLPQVIPTLAGPGVIAQAPLALQPPLQTIQPPIQAMQISSAVAQESVKALDQAAMANLATFISINPNIQHFITNPGHRKFVAVAVDRAIREVIQPAIERSVTIACVTTKELVLKDYAYEVNEKTVVSAAQLMASSLASSLSLVTCKEPLRLSIGNHLRAVLAQFVTDVAAIDQIASTCASDNVDLGCVLIERAAAEKASRDVAEALSSDLPSRRRQIESGQPLAEPANSKPSRFPKELPDSLRPRAGALQSIHLALYEGFQKPKLSSPQIPLHGISGPTSSILASMPTQPGPLPLLDPRMNPAVAPAGMLSMSQALEEYEMCLLRVDNSLKLVMRQAQGREVTLAMLTADHGIFVQLREMIIITQKIQPNFRVETALTFAESVFKRFAENLSSADTLRLEVVVGIFEALREACGGIKKFVPDLVSWLSQYAVMNASNDELGKKVHRTVLILFLKAKLLRSADIDLYFATYMDSGRNMVWVEIALDFIRQCLTEDLAAIFEFPKTFDTVSKMRQSNVTVKKQLQKWLTDLRVLANAKDEQKGAGINPSTPSRDTTAREQVMSLIDRWLKIWSSANEALFGNYLQLMHQYGVLKTEEAADKFFRLSTELCVDACLKTGQQTDPAGAITLSFTVVDALSKLFLLLVRLADKETGDITLRVSLLARILNSIARTLVEDHESKKVANGAFDQRPYHRLFSILSQDLGIPDPKHEPSIAIIPILTTYSQIYLALQPSVVPGFSFGWLQLISHRSFMPQLLLMKGQKGWPVMHRLLIAMLLFLQPFLKHVQLTDAIRKLYKSTLRVFLVILHDFPEFLSDYHLSFCDVIPATCVQLRNLVLCAFPRSVRLPDPFTPNLKVDLLPEISQAPKILSDYSAVLSDRGLRSHIDTYLTTRQPADLPVSLGNMLASTTGNYSLPLVTALVVYVGSQAIFQQPQTKTPLQSSPAIDVFRALMSALDAEGRYLMINAMVNQLRFPNSHTHYFSCVLLFLFVDADSEILQEQITRVLLERLIVHKPHPWGLLITFIELIKNTRYGFWQRSFTKCAPEIEKVFDSVAKSCVGAVPAQP